jgi:hypothetical protein
MAHPDLQHESGNWKGTEIADWAWFLMAREKAMTKSAGGGFTFAGKVAAAFLVKMLRRNLFLGDRGNKQLKRF